MLLENQFEQKTRQALENARLKWGEEQRNETTKQCQDAVKRQQELWASERREKQSALERTKHELATVKKEYGIAIQKLKTELIEERKKTTHHRRQDSRMDAAEVIRNIIRRFSVDSWDKLLSLFTLFIQSQGTHASSRTGVQIVPTPWLCRPDQLGIGLSLGLQDSK